MLYSIRDYAMLLISVQYLMYVYYCTLVLLVTDMSNALNTSIISDIAQYLISIKIKGKFLFNLVFFWTN